MAKNWTIAEATEVILNGDKEAILDVGGRFPLATRAIAIAGEKAKDILSAFNFVTVRKVESVLKDGVEKYSEDDIEDPTEEKPVKKEKEVKEEKPVKGKRGRKPAAKKEEPVMNEPEEDADEEEEDYSSMSEVELFKICKKKGLKPAPKQKKQYYLDLLNPTEDDDSDDWDEEGEEKPVKKTTKKAPAKKSEKAASEDEDDDWDI